MELEGYRYVMEQQVVWRDLDALGHVNNAVYATYFETGRMGYVTALGGSAEQFYGLILAEITITFKSPAFLQEKLVIGQRVSEIRNSSFIMEAQIEAKETGRLVATSKAVLVCYDYTQNKAVPMPTEMRAAISQLEGRPVLA